MAWVVGPSADQGTSRSNAVVCWVYARGCSPLVLGVVVWWPVLEMQQQKGEQAVPPKTVLRRLQSTACTGCRLKTPRQLLRSCAVSGHLESGRAHGMISQTGKTVVGLTVRTLAYRRCAPSALRADHCKLILSSRDSRTLRYSKGVGLRKYEHGYLRNSSY